MRAVRGELQHLLALSAIEEDAGNRASVPAFHSSMDPFANCGCTGGLADVDRGPQFPSVLGMPVDVLKGSTNKLAWTAHCTRRCTFRSSNPAQL